MEGRGGQSFKAATLAKKKDFVFFLAFLCCHLNKQEVTSGSGSAQESQSKTSPEGVKTRVGGGKRKKRSRRGCQQAGEGEVFMRC